MPKNIVPKENFSIFDSVAIVVGVVVGVGIFKTPSLVASVSDNGTMFILFWILGGLISLMGALCYAELTSTYPDAGGDYYFLKRAFGNGLAFLFSWSRMTVIQSGSIAMVAFLIGDYASEIFRLGAGSSSIYAVMTVVVLTAINMRGTQLGKRIQNMLVGLIIFGILLMTLSAISISPPVDLLSFNNIVPGKAALGTAMIFVLLTYGGWNEAAFISAEVNSKQKNMAKVLFYGIAIVTIIYLLVNIALIKGLGLDALSQSQTVMVDLMKKTIGSGAARLVIALVLIAALSTANATIITGARTNYALGRDYSIFRFFGVWQEERNTPQNALLAQGAIAMALVFFGSQFKDGFVMMVEYISPVFWFFFFMSGMALFVLRYRNKDLSRAFQVPFYPITPILFCLVCLYMFYSSIVYTGWGSLVGFGVLLAGIPVLFLQRKKTDAHLKKQSHVHKEGERNAKKFF